MASFKDTKGRTWPIEFSLGLLTRVRTETGVDLLTLHEPDSPALKSMQEDPVALLQVLTVTLRPRLREQGVSDEEFGESLQEEHVWNAVEALFQAMVDYYPPAKRAALQTLLQTMFGAARKVRDKSTRKLQQVLGATDLESLETKIARQIERSISGNTTTGLPASPADSTPTD